MTNFEQGEKNLKTHSESAVVDKNTVTTLEEFLQTDGKIITNFAANDKWPNIDGTFEFVPNPVLDRRPMQNFFVQIKGTHDYTELSDGGIKYSLRSLAFPAFINREVTLDPGILFVVLNPNIRKQKRVFWKYMSIEFINSIDFSKKSCTITFSAEEEIFNTDESADSFCRHLIDIVNQHSFVKKLESIEYTEADVIKAIKLCDEQITECIDRLDIYNDTRDNVSKRILNRLNELCIATLLINSLKKGGESTNLRLAWEQASLDIETKYLGSFLRMLKYLGNKIPDDGQSERLMLKYFSFMWQIRKNLNDFFQISILNNLEKFPLKIDKVDKEYYESVAKAFKSVVLMPSGLRSSRYYIQKKVPFYIGKERYFELTLQLAGVYATKFNRITAYTKEDLATNYSIQIGYEEATIDLWGIESKIKIINNWKVSIDPSCLNKLAKILRLDIKISTNYGEYDALMSFLTRTGINLLDFIDFREVKFSNIVEHIYKNTNTSNFKGVLIFLKQNYSAVSTIFGRNVIRYLLLHLKEETLESVLPTKFSKTFQNEELYLSSKCYPFERNPLISNLAGSKTSGDNLVSDVIRAVGDGKVKIIRPYIFIKNLINITGEIYFDENLIDNKNSKKIISEFNHELDYWERQQGYQLEHENGLVYITSYERDTLAILQGLRDISKDGNKGQKEYNQNFITRNEIQFTDDIKKSAIENIFVKSKVLIIYGAAGTGKTTLINYISNLMSNRRKLFLTKTHTALQNIRRRIVNPGSNADFISIDSFTKKVVLSEYDIIFVDECSTIDNRTMVRLIGKLNPNALLVLAGDIYQLESIEFGNWFSYAKDILKDGAKVELLNSWRTNEQQLINLWNEVRRRGNLITEKLSLDGPFSEDIGPNILKKEDDDEVVLCLNYDGKFGLNNINNYFQNANKENEAVIWQEWSYKVGDPILFNETKRFNLIYNNLKGKIVEIFKKNKQITFTIDIELLITELDCRFEELEFLGVFNGYSRIRFTVFEDDGGTTEEERALSRMRSVVPFQLAYAVSIHKSQGLEYNSVKIIIPSSNAEKITHGIFYTAITRAKKKLKIFWSAETMQEIVKSFEIEDLKNKSLEIVKQKLH